MLLNIGKTFAQFFLERVLDPLSMDEIAALCRAENGRPTKDPRAIAGAIILQRMFGSPTTSPDSNTRTAFSGRKP
jgi:CubicO group peptidase (beta-lactamase class C family)